MCIHLNLMIFTKIIRGFISAEYVFCQARADGDKDRQALASLLTAAFGSRVIVYENSRRFEFINPDEIASGKRLIIKHLQDESQSDINAY